VQSGADLTGESWAAVYGFLLAHHPDAFIGENVMNLNSEVPGSDETDAQYITRKLREAGYGTVEMMVLDAPRFGSRALRRRLYWLALLGEDRGRGALLQTMIKAMETPEAHSVGRLATKIVSCVSS
jgi:site-specific DNA-cytosine methylase